MRPTQADIARIANVSQATVSRVFAGDTRVEASVAEAVRNVMREYNYRPDERARSLRGKGSGMIGLVVRRPSAGLAEDPFFSTLVSHILDFLVGTPYHLCLDVVPTLQSQKSIYDEMLRTRRVDGLILVESETRDPRIQKLHDDRFPFVLIGNYVGTDEDRLTILSVDNDNVLAGEMATKHLVDNGYQRIGILGGPPGIFVSEDRIAGYRKVMQDQRKEELIWHSEFGYEAARIAARSILTSRDRPDALVVLDDFMAMGVVNAARELGIDIPAQLGVVGFNDSILCGLIPGGLSSVSLNIPRMVNSACGLLLKAIGDEPIDGPRQITIPCELSARGSSHSGGQES
jgi:DNA-binding LacI/PurR family transcriptional regulator